MANVYRIFVEKKKGNDIEAMQILTDLRQNVGITALTACGLLTATMCRASARRSSAVPCTGSLPRTIWTIRQTK